MLPGMVFQFHRESWFAIPGSIKSCKNIIPGMVKCDGTEKCHILYQNSVRNVGFCKFEVENSLTVNWKFKNQITN